MIVRGWGKWTRVTRGRYRSSGVAFLHLNARFEERGVKVINGVDGFEEECGVCARRTKNGP